MKKLISMTDFVIEIDKPYVSPSSPFSRHNQYSKIINYANFLKQPLKLEMFVPCVDNEPFNYTLHGNKEQFDKAKEKVLFEGFEIHDIYVTHNFEFTMQLSDISGFTVEDIVGYDIELTENALKQIGI